MSDLRRAALAVVHAWDTDGPVLTMEDLRAALAQPEQEPVAWGCFRGGVLLDDLVSDEASVDYWCESDEPEMQRLVKRALYTHPPQRKPLTDDEIELAYREIWRDLSDGFSHTSVEWIEAGIRYAEKMHGIE